MTGTAETEAAEFSHIYHLDVAVIPTNEPMVRIDHTDQIYKTEEAKFRAVLQDIIAQHEQGRPVLVGTTSIAKSEKLSKMLRAKRRDIRYQVLNAKEHAREATIIAQAGLRSGVTIATNMAGRGVDILLGGNPEGMVMESLRKVKIDPATVEEDSEEWKVAYEEAKAVCDANREEVLKVGGLHIIGTERHDSRRIDNQLRGRSGRQGDPGSSRFYLSLEDDLMRKFGSDRLSGMMDRVGMEEDIPIEHPWVTKALEKAQRRVEERHFEIRKNVLKFDDVMNTQRQTIYEMRNSILKGEDLKNTIEDMVEDTLDDHFEADLPDRNEDRDIESFITWLSHTFPINPSDWEIPPDKMSREEFREEISKLLHELYEARETEMGVEHMRVLERLVLLDRIDSHWKDHLYNIDYIEEGIHLRGYGGKDPIVVFKNEAYAVFEAMYQRIEEEVSEYMFKARIVDSETHLRQTRSRHFAQGSPGFRSRRAMPHYGRRRSTVPQPGDGGSTDLDTFASQQASEQMPKVGRNEICPCGSGKKYKKCHGR
jgi:preprotein translocase subunit SecA